MGGKVSISSIVGVGSTFKVELPVAIATSNFPATTEWRPVKSLAPEQPQWRLLIVDDNDDNRLLLVTLLTEVGFQVREAENGQEAIKNFTAWQPHLIWMDMRMPVMDGYEATMKIRQLAGGNAVKIIALTASAFKEQHDSIINAGCDDVLHKPVHAQEILEALVKHLGVKFIYCGQSTEAGLPLLELTAEILAKLPLALREQLYKAALNLDTEETEAIIGKICSMTPDVAQALEKLSQGYQFDQIIQLLSSNSELTL